jgi:hypothetical protein
VAAAVLGIAALIGLVARRRRPAREPVAMSVIRDPANPTVVDETGAVRSVQGADLTLPEHELERIWSPMHLERLARTYWRFLSRASLGLIRVRYSTAARAVVFLGPPLVLLRFHAPEYEMDTRRGIVRWRIKDGLLVSRRGRNRGHLKIDAQRFASDAPGQARLRIAVEVASFYPAIASGISLRLYKATQSRIHVIVTHSFLRSLARLDLAESRVGRFAARPFAPPPTIDEVPDPREPAIAGR